MDLQEVQIPKSYFRQERDTLYDDWTISFWREFFQNSVDAGAKNIAITIEETAARGSFDREADDEKITRVVFSDDGSGMSADTIRDIYFALGRTTKSEGSGAVGGFGRARLMTCFSQKRYSIVTQDSFVMGDGGQYVLFDLATAGNELAEAISRLGGSGSIATAGLEADLAMVRQASDRGGFDGCRIEVDLDHVRTSSWRKIPTADVMSERLKEYLAESQISPTVTINGKSPEEFFQIQGKLQARRGPAKRALRAEMDGQEVQFATVHTSEGEKAAYKGRMIVRVDGASMYAEHIGAPNVQVILEIDSKLSRTVLNANRDGIKPPFKQVVAGLLQELATDDISALKEKEARNSYRLAGDKGLLLSSKAVSLEKVIKETVSVDEVRALVRSMEASVRKKKYQTIEDLAEDGVTEDAIRHFMDSIWYRTGFFDEALWHHEMPRSIRDQLSVFETEAAGARWDSVKCFLEKAPDALKEWVVGTLSARIKREKQALREEQEKARLADQTDVYMHIVSTNEKTKAAITRHHPSKWNSETGRGRMLKMQLAAWTAACSVAIEALREVRPALEDFNWMTGFVFATPEMTFEGDSSRQRPTLAMHKVDSDTGAHVYMFNPLKPDGSLAYRLTSAADRRELYASALHEVAHTVSSLHNESFALTLTDLVQEVDFDEVNRRMKQQERAVAAAFSGGRSRVQQMDDEPGPRPAERLLALSAGNSPDWDAVSYNADGTYVADCDRISRREDAYLDDENDYVARRTV